MKVALVLILVLASVGPNTAQNKDAVGDFAKSPTEHIINQLEQPFVVRSVEGSITVGYQDPLPNVLVEIQGPEPDRKIRRITTDKQGRFRIAHVPVGTYKFKTTLDGFQSVMGTITVSTNVSKGKKIKLDMSVGV